jgi:hypothetical protein
MHGPLLAHAATWHSGDVHAQPMPCFRTVPLFFRTKKEPAAEEADAQAEAQGVAASGGQAGGSAAAAAAAGLRVNAFNTALERVSRRYDEAAAALAAQLTVPTGP